MSALDLDELERLAQAATPGPWEMGRSSIMCRACVHLRGCFSIYQEADCTDVTHPHAGLDQQDAAYIAAANPATVLAMIKRMREARTALDYSLQSEPQKDADKRIWYANMKAWKLLGGER